MGVWQMSGVLEWIAACPLHETLHDFDSTSHLSWHNHFPLNCMIESAPCFLHAFKVTNVHCINHPTLFSNYSPKFPFPKFLFYSLHLFFLFHCFLLTHITFKELDPNQPLKQVEDQRRVGKAFGLLWSGRDPHLTNDGQLTVVRPSQSHCFHSMAPTHSPDTL